MKRALAIVLVLVATSVALADKYDDLVTLAQQCKLASVQTNQAAVVEAAAEAALVQAQQARDVLLAGFDRQARDAELLQLAADFQAAVATQNWAEVARILALMTQKNQERDQLQRDLDAAQAKVNQASTTLSAAEKDLYAKDESRKKALRTLATATDVIIRERQSPGP